MCAPDVGHVDALRGRLEQHVDRVAQQAPGPRAGSAGRSRPTRRVGAGPAGQGDDDGGDDDGDRAREVAHAPRDRRRACSGSRLGVAEQQQRDAVARRARGGRRRASARTRLGRLGQPPPRLEQDERGDRRTAGRRSRPRPGSRAAGSRTSARASAGRPANQIASSARPIPATSVNTWPASARRARLFGGDPPTSSTTRTASVIGKTDEEAAAVGGGGRAVRVGHQAQRRPAAAGTGRRWTTLQVCARSAGVSLRSGGSPYVPRSSPCTGARCPTPGRTSAGSRRR